VLGGGPIGLELGQGFSYLGSKVTVIDRSSGLFKKDDPEVGPLMEERLLSEGMDLMFESTIKEIKKDNHNITAIVESKGKIKEVTGDNLLLSVGRTPVSQGLGLEQLGISTGKRGFIITNKRLQTRLKNIYACGDVTGPYLFTHMASYQASICIKNIIFRLRTRTDYSQFPGQPIQSLRWLIQVILNNRLNLSDYFQKSFL